MSPTSIGSHYGFEVQASANGENDSQLCSVETTIKARPGHPVILGLTPINSKPSLFIVEIIQTEPADDVKAEKPDDAR